MSKMPFLVILLVIVLTGLGCSSYGYQGDDSKYLPPTPMPEIGIHGRDERPDWPSTGPPLDRQHPEQH
jgi:hypothetical protein